MKVKQWQNTFYVIENANRIVKHLTQIKNVVMKHVNVSVKFIVHEKMIIVGILFNKYC